MDEPKLNKTEGNNILEKNQKRKIVKFNHAINIYTYNNIALFKGDTYPYRGIFKRCGGEFSKKNYGYLIPLNRVSEAKLQIIKFVESLMCYKKDENLDISHMENVFVNENFDNYADTIDSINSSNIMDIDN
jgi:hypothetical protein